MSLAALALPPHTGRRLLTALRIALVACLAVGTTRIVADRAHAPTRLAHLASAERGAQARLDRVALATSGSVYASVQDEEVQVFGAGMLDHLRCLTSARNEYFDCPTGVRPGLLPLRKSIEHLVAFMLLPLLGISLLHAVITSRGGSPEGVMTKTALKLFTVIIMLWAYPAWDVLIFDQVTMPVVKSLMTGSLAQSVAGSSDVSKAVSGSIKGPGNASSLSNGECPKTFGDSGNVNSALAAWADLVSYTGDRDALLVKAHTLNCEAVLAGAGAYAIAKGSTSIPNSWASALAQGNFEAEAAKTRLGEADSPGFAERMERVANTLMNWFAESVSGMIMTIASLAANAMLWLTWIGVLAMKNISLAFAPIAFAWELWPGSNGKGQAWFMGHSKMLMRPIGVALTFLLFVVIFNGLFAPQPGASAGMVMASLGMKLALFVGFIIALAKGSFMTDIIAGDVAKAAMAVGGAIQGMATTALMGGAAIATGGAAALATGAMKGGGALTGAAGAAMSKTGPGKWAADKFGQVGGALSRAKETVRDKAHVIDRELNLSRNLKSAWANRATVDMASAASGAMVPKMTGVGKALKDGVTSPIAQGVAAFKSETRGTYRQFVPVADKHAVTEGATEAARGVNASRVAHDALAKEGVPVRATAYDRRPDSTNIVVPFANAGQADTEATLHGWMRSVAGDKHQLGYSIDTDDMGRSVVAADPSTLKVLQASLNKGDDEADRIGQAILKAARKVDPKADILKETKDGNKVVDLEKALPLLGVMGNALARVAQEQAAATEAAALRTLAGHRLGVEAGTMEDILLRNMEDKVLRQRGDENESQHKSRVREALDQQLRMAAAVQGGGNPHQVALAGASTKATIPLGFATSVQEEAVVHDIVAALREATPKVISQRLGERSCTVNGEEYGLQHADFEASGGTIEHFRSVAGSLWDQTLLAKMEAAERNGGQVKESEVFQDLYGQVLQELEKDPAFRDSPLRESNKDAWERTVNQAAVRRIFTDQANGAF